MPASLVICIMNQTSILFRVADTYVNNAAWDPDLDPSRSMIPPGLTFGRLVPTMPFHRCDASVSLDAPPSRPNEDIEIGFGLNPLQADGERCWVAAGVSCPVVQTHEWTADLPQENLYVAVVHIRRIGIPAPLSGRTA